MIRLRDIKLPAGHKEPDLIMKIEKTLCLDIIYPGNSYPQLSYKIIRRSIDARKKPDIFFVYTVGVTLFGKDEERILCFVNKNRKISRIRKLSDCMITDPVVKYEMPSKGNKELSKRPVVVGFGPAGMFASLLLARSGYCPIVIERGKRIEERAADVDEFWKSSHLKTESNVLFGEGGAGTFSDGKLNTLTKDTNGRNTFVLETFAGHGTDPDILTDAKPHIGTDVLRVVVRSIRQEIISLGGTVMFNTKLCRINRADGRVCSVSAVDTVTGEETVIDTEVLILCPGHSARDTFEMLYDTGTSIEQKSFACGFRVMHPQKLVDKWQYGDDSDKLGLPPADYKVANETSEGRRVYSFCMCPGGYVVNSSSEDGRICVNGMSYRDRGGYFANSAIIAAVDPKDFIQDEVSPDHPLAGMYYQRDIEEKAYNCADGAIPVQRFTDFEEDTASGDIEGIDRGVRGAVKPSNLRGIFSEDIDSAIIESMHKFGYTREGFDTDAVMLGVETRTSSPIRIVRDETLQSNIKGLYPCGEGAGYAGGITSAAADGIRTAEKIITTYGSPKEVG